MFEGLKRMLGLPDQQTYPLPVYDVVLPEHDEDNPHCSCPACIEALLLRLARGSTEGVTNE
jgi:hypothetical protein